MNHGDRSLKAFDELDSQTPSQYERRFTYELFGDAQARIDQPYVVKNLMGANTLAVLFGESGTGKSHVALDIAMAVSQGGRTLGCKTRKGAVLYVAAEGAHGLHNRLAAARERGLIAPGAPLAIVNRPLKMDVDSGDPLALVRTMADLAMSTGEQMQLVVIDTLARCMVGDENNSADMGRLVQACDFFRNATTAAVLVVHHSGKDSSKGARGHSSLRAAVDTEILVEGRQNPRTVTITKQRDIAVIDAVSFELEPVTLGHDADGEAVTACTMRLTARARPEPTGRNQRKLLAAVREHAQQTGGDLITSIDLGKIAKAQGLKDRRRFGEVRKSLVRDGWLIPSDEGHRIGSVVL